MAFWGPVGIRESKKWNNLVACLSSTLIWLPDLSNHSGLTRTSSSLSPLPTGYPTSFRLKTDRGFILFVHISWENNQVESLLKSLCLSSVEVRLGATYLPAETLKGTVVKMKGCLCIIQSHRSWLNASIILYSGSVGEDKRVSKQGRCEGWCTFKECVVAS